MESRLRRQRFPSTSTPYKSLLHLVLRHPKTVPDRGFVAKPTGGPDRSGCKEVPTGSSSLAISLLSPPVLPAGSSQSYRSIGLHGSDRIKLGTPPRNEDREREATAAGQCECS